MNDEPQLHDPAANRRRNLCQAYARRKHKHTPETIDLFTNEPRAIPKLPADIVKQIHAKPKEDPRPLSP